MPVDPTCLAACFSTTANATVIQINANQSNGLTPGLQLVWLVVFAAVESLAFMLLWQMMTFPTCLPKGGKQNLKETINVYKELKKSLPPGEKFSDWVKAKRINVSNYDGTKQAPRSVSQETKERQAPPSATNIPAKTSKQVKNFKQTDSSQHAIDNLFAESYKEDGNRYVDLPAAIGDNDKNTDTPVVSPMNYVTPMMAAINHLKKTLELMALIRQLLPGFEWSEATQNRLTMCQLHGKSKFLMSEVPGSPPLPKALDYSVVRARLGAIELSEKPWSGLKFSARSVLWSAYADLQIFLVHAIVLPTLLSCIIQE